MNFHRTSQQEGNCTEEDHDDTNSAHNDSGPRATNALIADADNSVSVCNDLLTAGLATIARKLPTDRTITAIYKAYCAIRATGREAHFLSERRIKIHGSTKNSCYPIFRAFTKGTHPLLRNRVCKYAEVAALATLENISPGDFSEWLKSHPIEKACAEYRRVIRESEKAARNEDLKRIWRVLVDPKKNPEMAPIIPATPITPGFVGMKLAVLAFADDGTGDFRLVGIMPQETDVVMSMVRKAASQSAP